MPAEETQAFLLQQLMQRGASLQPRPEKVRAVLEQAIELFAPPSDVEKSGAMLSQETIRGLASTHAKAVEEKMKAWIAVRMEGALDAVVRTIYGRALAMEESSQGAAPVSVGVAGASATAVAGVGAVGEPQADQQEEAASCMARLVQLVHTTASTYGSGDPRFAGALKVCWGYRGGEANKKKKNATCLRWRTLS